MEKIKGFNPRKTVNIGMITFNRLDFTRQAIDSLLKHTDYPYVLTVIDNHSEDGSRDYLSKLKDRGIIKNLVLLEQNIGVPKAVNLAWHQEPELDYFLKLDNDIVIHKPGWLTDMIETIESVPVIGALGYNFETRSYPLQKINGRKIRTKDYNIGGACFLIPRRTERLIGYFCEKYGLYGEEDTDYGLRIKLMGLLNAYMEDENMGFHLPTGRAAKIDDTSYIALDGQEETIHNHYRKFKDECRRKAFSMKGLFEKNVQDYHSFTIPFYFESIHTRDGRVKPRPDTFSDLSAGEAALYRKAHQAFVNGDYQKTLTLLKGLSGPWARIRRGYIYYQDKELAKARAEFKNAAIESNLQLLKKKESGGMKSIAEEYYNLARIYNYVAEFPAAVKWYRKALRFSGDHWQRARYFNELSECLQKKGGGSFKEYLKKGILELNMLGRKNLPQHLLLGEMYFKLQIYDQSERQFKRILKFREIPVLTGASAFFYLGEIAQISGKPHWKSYFRKGLSLLLQRENKKAVEVYRIASLYKRIREFDSALSWFGKLLCEDTPRELKAGAYFHIGDIRRQQKDYYQAKAHWEKCLELNPHHQKARQYLLEVKNNQRI